ncbi:unnamed protein product [Cunninghamella blakesleeana]
MVAISINSIVLAIFAATSVLAATTNQHGVNTKAVEQPSKNHGNKHHGNSHHGGKHKGKGKGHGKKKNPPKKSSSNAKIAAYVTDWSLPNNIAWSKLDHIYYAFGIPDESGKISGFDQSQLQQVVKQAHDNQKTISLSVGGWTGSKYFSNLVISDTSRTAFADTLTKLVNDYNLDGIDIDWEYPNSPNGVACNANNPKDTDNYLELMKLLRKQLGDKKLITAAVAINPFNDGSQEPSYDLNSAWGTTVDYLNVMVYDLAGMWNPTTFANAALKGNGQAGSVDGAIKAWSDAGFPKNKLVVGVPFYGYLAAVSQAPTAVNENVPFSGSSQIKGDQYDEKSADPCPGAEASYSGEYQYRSIVAENIQKNASNWVTYWDSKTFTPYAYNSDKKTFLTFDNPDSLKAKADYVNENNLGGMMMWSLEMDDSDNSLLTAMQGIRK